MKDEKAIMGERFRQLRKELGLGQIETAKRLNISPSFLSALETGNRSPDILDKGDLLKRCMEVFKCDGDYLKGKTESLPIQFTRLKQYSESLFRSAAQGKIPVLVIGDLCVDQIDHLESQTGSVTVNLGEDSDSPGGQGFNAASALADEEKTLPMLFGGLGDDSDSKVMLDAIKEKNIISFVLSLKGKKTGKCTILYEPEGNRKKIYSKTKKDENDANDFTSVELRSVLELSGLDSNGVIYFIPTVFPRYKERQNAGREDHHQPFDEYINSIMEALDKSHARLAIRIPQEFINLSSKEFNLITKNADVLITEIHTLAEIYCNKIDAKDLPKRGEQKSSPEMDEKIITILKKTEGKTGQQIIVFYGGNSQIDHVAKYERLKNGFIKDDTMGNEDTEYMMASNKVGFIEQFIFSKELLINAILGKQAE